jgi:hypothetical protein
MLLCGDSDDNNNSDLRVVYFEIDRPRMCSIDSCC